MSNKKKMKWLVIPSFVLATLLSFIPSVGATDTYNPINIDYSMTETPDEEDVIYFRVDLFDYNSEDPDQISSAIARDYPSASRSSYFSFYGAGSSTSGFSMISKYTGDNGGILKNLMKSTLGTDGIRYSNGITGINLFDTDATDYDVYSNALFPFKFEDGKYVYDSEENSVLLDTATGILSLDDANGGFWPFGENSYHFGMHMSVDFYIPSGKKVDGDSIIFNFSGDDDVWVFIDGQLVLDIGGIHQAYSGSINFTNGKITEPKVFSVYPDLTDDHNHTGNIYFSSFIASLAENSVHTLEIYYLERGAGFSNCRIEFNMPEYEPLVIAKEVTELNAGVENNTSFLFNIKTTVDRCDGLTNYVGEYDLYEGSTFIGRYSTDGTGCFLLNDGQEARFDRLLVGTYFEVTEVSASQKDFYTYFPAADWGEENDLVSAEGYVISGTLVPDSTAERSYRLTCENERQTTDFSFKKTDSITGAPIAGSVFQLEGMSNLDESISLTAMSDENGIVEFTDVPCGSYSMKEITANDGYILNETQYNLTIGMDETDSFVLTISVGETMVYSGSVVSTFAVKNLPKEISISGTKTWDDSNNKYNSRPKEITVNLLADGAVVATKVVSASDDWEYAFEGLPTTSDGKQIAYTVQEAAVANFTPTYDGYDITNTYTPPYLLILPTGAISSSIWQRF
jgi:fibro-slime domain-containing protein